jgi:hypothetical protein
VSRVGIEPTTRRLRDSVDRAVVANSSAMIATLDGRVGIVPAERCSSRSIRNWNGVASFTSASSCRRRSLDHHRVIAFVLDAMMKAHRRRAWSCRRFLDGETAGQDDGAVRNETDRDVETPGTPSF